VKNNGGALLSDEVYANPAEFVRRFLPSVEMRDYQERMLEAVANNKRVAIYAPRGVGKTAPLAWLIHWYALTREKRRQQWKILTVASSWLQLTQYLWQEVHKWSRELQWDIIGTEYDSKQLQLKSLALDYGKAFSASCSDPNKLEGAHADEILVLIDEAKGVPPAIWDALEGIGTAGTTQFIAVSTPSMPVGRFYDICSGKRGYTDWAVQRITVEDAIREGSMDERYLEKRKQQWGEDSAVYRQHILGEFAGVSEGRLIELSWLERAVKSTGGEEPVVKHIGVDVAEYGDDETVLAFYTGSGIEKIETYTGTNLMEVVGRVINASNAGSVPVSVDSIGVGAGVYARLTEQGIYAKRYMASERAVDSRYLNKRAESYWNLRDRLQEGTLTLPDDPMLREELLSIQWELNSAGKIKIVAKDKIKKTLGRSPDRADAVAMAVYEPTERISPNDIVYA